MENRGRSRTASPLRSLAMDSVSAWETSSSSGGTPRLRELHHLKPAQRAVDKRHVATRVEHLGQPENIPRAEVGRRRDAERVGE